MKEISIILAIAAAVVGLIQLFQHSAGGDNKSPNVDYVRIALHGSWRKFESWLDTANEDQLYTLLQQLLDKPMRIRPYQIGSLALIQRSITAQTKSVNSLVKLLATRRDDDSVKSAEEVAACLAIQSRIVNTKGVISWIKGEADLEVATEYDRAEVKKKSICDLLQRLNNKAG